MIDFVKKNEHVQLQENHSYLLLCKFETGLGVLLAETNTFCIHNDSAKAMRVPSNWFKMKSFCPKTECIHA